MFEDDDEEQEAEEQHDITRGKKGEPNKNTVKKTSKTLGDQKLKKCSQSKTGKNELSNKKKSDPNKDEKAIAVKPKTAKSPTSASKSHSKATVSPRGDRMGSFRGAHDSDSDDSSSSSSDGDDDSIGVHDLKKKNNNVSSRKDGSSNTQALNESSGSSHQNSNNHHGSLNPSEAFQKSPLLKAQSAISIPVSTTSEATRVRPLKSHSSASLASHRESNAIITNNNGASLKSFRGGDSPSDDESIHAKDLKKNRKDKDADSSKKTEDEKNESSSSKLNASASKLNASASRLAVLTGKLRRPDLPQFDEEPDWLFKPSEEKLKKCGVLGISAMLQSERKLIKLESQRKMMDYDEDVSSESKEFAKQFMKQLDSDKDLKKSIIFAGEADSSSPEIKLMKLIDLDPWSGKKHYDDELTQKLLKEHPELCEKKLNFEFTKDPIFPLTMLCALGASEKTIKICYKAHPDAIEHNDRWIGTCLHYACHYRANKKVIKFLMEKNDDMADETNLAKRLPLHTAVMAHSSAEVIALVIKGNKGALKRKDREGNTPLHHAANRTDADLEVIELLTKKYAKACVEKNNQGSTPLHLAVAHSTTLPILEALMFASDEALYMEDDRGNLPLHTSLHSNTELKITQFLLWQHQGAMIHKNKAGDTPLDMAKRIRRKDYPLHEILTPAPTEADDESED